MLTKGMQALVGAEDAEGQRRAERASAGTT